MIKCSESCEKVSAFFTANLQFQVTVWNSLSTLQSLISENKTFLFDFLPSSVFLHPLPYMEHKTIEFSSSWRPFYVAYFTYDIWVIETIQQIYSWYNKLVLLLFTIYWRYILDLSPRTLTVSATIPGTYSQLFYL